MRARQGARRAGGRAAVHDGVSVPARAGRPQPDRRSSASATGAGSGSPITRRRSTPAWPAWRSGLDVARGARRAVARDVRPGRDRVDHDRRAAPARGRHPLHRADARATRSTRTRRRRRPAPLRALFTQERGGAGRDLPRGHRARRAEHVLASRSRAPAFPRHRLAGARRRTLAPRTSTSRSRC